MPRHTSHPEQRLPQRFELLAELERHIKIAADAWSQNCDWAAEAAYHRAICCYEQLKASDR